MNRETTERFIRNQEETETRKTNPTKMVSNLEKNAKKSLEIGLGVEKQTTGKSQGNAACEQMTEY